MLRPLEMAHDFLREVITDQDTVVDATYWVMGMIRFSWRN